MIEAREITVKYGKRLILDRCALSVEPGECVGLLGPSGCGKSTLLRVIVGEQHPSSGSVSIGGWKPSPSRETTPPPGLFGIVHQDPVGSLDRLWSVAQCVREPLAALGTDRETQCSMMKSMLAYVRLGHIHPETPVRSLSIGQAQRVAMARALIGNPNVVLADEPTSALDPTTAATIVVLLREAAMNGASVVVVSHNDALLASFCDRILEMRNGQLYPRPSEEENGVEPILSESNRY